LEKLNREKEEECENKSQGEELLEGQHKLTKGNKTKALTDNKNRKSINLG
jgi:hypothetical protein